MDNHSDSRKILVHLRDDPPPSYDIHGDLKSAISSSLKKCPLSRYEVAAAMSQKLNTDITKSMLDSWSAESKEWHRIPAEYIPAFCAATGSAEVMFILVRPIQGIHLIETRDLLQIELQKAQEKIKDWTRYYRRLKDEIADTDAPNV
jgi:hypothetical protein